MSRNVSEKIENVENLNFYSAFLENNGIEYEFTDTGLIKYKNGYEEVFETMGYVEIPEEKVKKLAKIDNPSEIQNDNTYNYDAYLWKDANFGYMEIPSGVIVSFKVHRGGDVRGNYSENKYYYMEDTCLDDEIGIIKDIFKPTLQFEFDYNGEKIKGRLFSGGEVEWVEKYRGFISEQNIGKKLIWKLHYNYNELRG
ncbi:MAG: hypothetical protein ACOCP8_02090 [archaeon]